MRSPFQPDRPFVPAHAAEDPLLRALLAPAPADARHCVRALACVTAPAYPCACSTCARGRQTAVQSL
jgi:hypothetical protein